MRDMRSAIRLVSMILVFAILAVSVSYVIIINTNRAKWINLANNTDFSVETIAKQANRIKENTQSNDGEVYISLH